MTKPIRTTEEYIILSLSGLTTVSLLPFAVLRGFNGEWAIALLDSAAVIGCAVLFLHVFKTHETKIPGKIMAGICLLVLILTVQLKGTAQLNWTYPALTAVFFLITPKTAALLCSLCLMILGLMIWPQISLVQALTFYVSSIATITFVYAFADRMRKQQKQLLHLATKDPLTGAGNRRAMEQKLLEMMAFHRRNIKVPACLILMDLDKFKLINDEHGHNVGDDILVDFVRVIDGRIRESDSLYRFGGEEFVVIAENTALADGLSLAEELRSSVENSEMMRNYKVTISVGTAQYQPDETAFEWLGRADKAMYLAKDAGRNVCCVA